jgi:hypothetical protein
MGIRHTSSIKEENTACTCSTMVRSLPDLSDLAVGVDL